MATELNPDSVATRVERPAGEQDELTSRDANLSINTPEQAIRNDEVERYRRVGFPAIAVTIVGLSIAIPFLPGDATARLLFTIGLAAYGVGASWFRLKIRNPAQFNERNLFIQGVAGCFAAFGALYYWGAFSPAPVVIAAVLFVNSMDGGLRYTVFVYALCAAMQLIIGVGIITGGIEDRGLIRADDASLLTQVFTQVAIQMTLLLAFYGGRTFKRVQLESLVRLDTAAREAAKREALIDEIKQDLKRAAHINTPGKFSEQVLGSFTLGVVIGRGGMGEVYEARHRETGEPAAVKLLLATHFADPQHVQRFEREARAASAIDSPHVVRILEVGDQVPYIAMEKLEGSSLAALLQQRGQLPLDEVIVLVEQVARGLDAARAKGIVHRDLKPHNLWLAKQPGGSTIWKILDFGVSKLADHSGTLTQGAIIGTPAYMAPEQARGQSVDHRADVYGLGAIAYRCLTGQAPFQSSGELAQVVYEVVHRMPMRPSQLAPVSPQVDAVLAIALSKTPGTRFATTLELASTLREAASGKLDASVLEQAEVAQRGMPWAPRVSAMMTAPA